MNPLPKSDKLNVASSCVSARPKRAEEHHMALLNTYCLSVEVANLLRVHSLFSLSWGTLNEQEAVKQVVLIGNKSPN